MSVDPLDPSLPAFGTVAGEVRFAFTGIGIPDATVPVVFELRPVGGTNPPFGFVDTPLMGATGVSGAMAVTGWALDDVGTVAVRVCRAAVLGETAAPEQRCGTGQVFIGDATFVPGARPDVAAAWPSVPIADRAGWGLLVLTNVLPAGGNGPLTLFVYADDQEGNRTLLAERSITLDNAHSNVPFGTIDTPAQGATVSGHVTNFGWVLSPGTARADGAGGGVVDVLIDGVPVGSPTGWTGRPDLAALFPVGQYAGVDSALAVFGFDSRAYADGVHTIAWRVVDSEGNAAGIGSRYFTIANATAGVRLSPGRE